MMIIPNYSSSFDSSSKKKCDHEESKEYKSKNLVAERKRRQKLSDRLLELRSLCPNITNMNKATIITDAITYVEELKQTVDDLSNELTLMDATIKEEYIGGRNIEGIDLFEKEMKSCNVVETAVHVRHLNGNKLWIHITCQKKIGTLTRILEAINALGLHVQDTSVTSAMGALLFTACLEADHGGFVEVAGIKEFMMQTLRTI